jgi:PhnB protein
MQLNTYLLFDGTCEEAFKFYERVLGGKIEAMMRHEGTPAECHVPAEWRGKIMHARLVVGDKFFLMASDAPPGTNKPMGGFSVNVAVDTPTEAERIFNALAEKGTVNMPMAQTFFAARFGMLVDRFGTPWMVICEKAA